MTFHDELDRWRNEQAQAAQRRAAAQAERDAPQIAFDKEMKDRLDRVEPWFRQVVGSAISDLQQTARSVLGDPPDNSYAYRSYAYRPTTGVVQRERVRVSVGWWIFARDEMRERLFIGASAGIVSTYHPAFGAQFSDGTSIGSEAFTAEAPSWQVTVTYDPEADVLIVEGSGKPTMKAKRSTWSSQRLHAALISLLPLVRD